MDTKNIIVILLFIIPGLMSEKISHLLDMPKDSQRTEFRDLVNGAILSLPILICVGVIIKCWLGFKSFQQYISAFGDIVFLIKFIILISCISIIFGAIKGVLSPYIYKYIVTNIRVKLLNRTEIDDESCWRKAFINEFDSHYVKIIKDGKEISKGFTKNVSIPGEEKSMVLYLPEDLYDYPEYVDCFKIIKNVYINIEKSIVIEDYDTKEYKKWCDKLKEENTN